MCIVILIIGCTISYFMGNAMGFKAGEEIARLDFQMELEERGLK